MVVLPCESAWPTISSPLALAAGGRRSDESSRNTPLDVTSRGRAGDPVGLGDAEPSDATRQGSNCFPERDDLCCQTRTGRGLVLRDRLIDFEIRNAAGDLIYKGKLQDRVVKSGVDGTLSFYLFIRNTQQDLPGAITSVTRGNFANFQTDVEFRVDGLGHIGPKEANRSSDGENITFDFEKEPVHSGNDSRFFFILTDTTEYAPESGSTILRTTDGSSVRLATSAPLSVPRPRSAVASKNADSGPKADALRPHEAEGSRESPADYTLWTSAFGFIAPAHSVL